MILLKILFILQFYFIFILGQDDGTIVSLEKGKIQGIIRKSENNNDYWAFQEIPYAAPPVGSNRLQLAQKPQPWNNILNTTRNTKICYQLASRYANLKMSEDCLYLNVYTPEKPGNSSLIPVLLWIHGGSYIRLSGAYEYYGPRYIMDHGVIVVTINYRLGPFGFLGTDDGIIPFNIGLKDQRLAIEWVGENIALFGGNPNHIILVGESAGSKSIGYHLMSQKPDENLFHGVIMQSGSPIGPIYKQSNCSTNAFNTARAIDNTFTSNNTLEILKVLQNAEAKDIYAKGLGRATCVEKEGLFSKPVYQTYLDKKFKKIPVLMGFNSEELLAKCLIYNQTLPEHVDDNYDILIDRIHIATENRSTFGSLLKHVYDENGLFANNLGGYIRYLSDGYYINSICKHVELCSGDSPHYFYQFSYKGALGQKLNLSIPQGAERVAHAEDLHYLWDDTTNSDLSQFPMADQVTLHRIVKMWTNFVKYFNPTTEKDPLLDNIIWLKSDPVTLRYLNINETLEMRKHPRQYQQVKQILEKYMEPPYDSF